MATERDRQQARLAEVVAEVERISPSADGEVDPKEYRKTSTGVLVTKREWRDRIRIRRAEGGVSHS